MDLKASYNSTKYIQKIFYSFIDTLWFLRCRLVFATVFTSVISEIENLSYVEYDEKELVKKS